MSGFYVRRASESIEKIIQKSGSLSLLSHGDNVEILFQEIEKDTVSFLEPYEGNELLEFFYVIDGEITCHDTDKEVVMKNGDYFYAYNLLSPVELKALVPTKLLYVSSKPLFKYLSHDISVLKDILKRVEEKDTYTHGHGKRVRDISRVLGKKLGLPSEKLEKLMLGALFHDIGKIEIPDEILKKPSKLTNEEFNLIKTHPVVGCEMVLNTFLEETYDIIRHHHERLNGSGYPDGISGDEITIESRIVAIADSFDAMTSKRPYREAMSYQEALEEIKSQAGKFYDGKMVKIFEKCLLEGLI